MSQKTTQYAINGSGGAWTQIRCTLGATRRMSIQEDGAANAGVQQGLQYQQGKNDGHTVHYGSTIAIPADLALEPFVIEAGVGDHAPNREPLGTGGSYPYPVSPGGPVTHGTIVLQIKSLTATATVIDVTEND